MAQEKIQLGKQGITDNFISNLNVLFKKTKSVKVVILKAAGHDREKIKEMKEELVKRLGGDYTARVIGFTIALRKGKKSDK